jgi:hypothetical protein
MPTKKAGRPHAAKIEHRRAVSRRRSQQARWEELRQRAAEQRRKRNRRIALGAGAVIVVAAVIAAVVLWPEKEPTLELRAPVVARDAEPLAIKTDTASYRVNYQVEVIADTGDVEYHYEKLSVRRPFDARITFHSGRTDADPEEFSSTVNLGLSSESTSGGQPEIRQSLPAAGRADIRLDVTLRDLVDAGYFTAREQRQVLGRPCTVYRTGRTVESNVAAKATDSDYVDVCIDEAGLMLEEMAVNNSKVSLRVIATEVTVAPEFSADEFTITGTPLGTADGAPVLTEIDKTVPPHANLLSLATPPEGFEHRARYLLREAPGAEAAASGVAPTNDSYVDVYVNGTRTLVVHQGLVAYEPTVDTTDAQTVNLGPWGDGKLVLGITGHTITVNPTGQWFIHLTASMSSADLQAVATQLR